jgi:hypothetical protein
MPIPRSGESGNRFRYGTQLCKILMARKLAAGRLAVRRSMTDHLK